MTSDADTPVPRCPDAGGATSANGTAKRDKPRRFVGGTTLWAGVGAIVTISANDRSLHARSLHADHAVVTTSRLNPKPRRLSIQRSQATRNT